MHNTIFSEKLPKGIATGCSNCSPTNKNLFWKTVSFLAKERPEAFKEVLGKYDSAGTFLSNFGDQLTMK